MAEKSLKEKTAKGLFWGGFSNTIQQLLNLIFGIFLGRLLLPTDYGMIGMITVFSVIANALQEGGFISALANKKNVSSCDYNAVFWFNVPFALSLYIILFFCAPHIADFYDIPALVPLSRFCFLGVIISSLAIVPRAIIFRNLKVKENAVISLCSLLISGVIGVILAVLGFSYWSLAIQSIIYISIVSILNWYYARWYPTFNIDLKPLKEMLRFSSRLLITNLFLILNGNLVTVILGKFYSSQEVGYFTQANKWNSMGYGIISGMINGVAQPVLSNVSDSVDRQLVVFRKLLRFTAFIAFPCMFGLGIVAKEVIVLAIGMKWIESVNLLEMLCIWGAFIPISSLFSQLLISRGHSSVYMWSNIFLALIQLSAMLVLYPYGIHIMISVFICLHISWLFVWFVLVRREIALTFMQLLKDILPFALIAAAVMGGAYYVANGLSDMWISLFVKVTVAASAYILFMWGTRSVIFRESIDYILKKKIINED